MYIYSKTKIAKKNALDKAKSKLNEHEKKLNNNLEMLKKERIGKETTDEKQTLLDKLKVLEEKKFQLESELKKHEKSNSVEYDHMKKSIKVSKIRQNYSIKHMRDCFKEELHTIDALYSIEYLKT